ncbi:MAG: sialidase family protein [Thermoplasmata archaeon]
MKKRPSKEELLSQFYRTEKRVISVPRIPVVPVLVVVMLLTVVVLSGFLISKADISFDFASYEPKPRSPAGWTDDVRLTSDSNPDRYPDISAKGDNVHIIWEKSITGVGTGYSDIYYKNSTDGGFSWSNDIRLTDGINDVYCRKPDIGLNESNIHIVWNREKAGAPAETKEIYYRNSTDGGISWGDTKMISEDDDNSSEAPRCVVNGDNIHVAWVDSRFGSLQSEVYYRRSVDGGITWDNGLGDTTSDRRLTHDFSNPGAPWIALNGSNIHVVFCDDRDTDFDVYYIRSTDNGATWDNGLGTVNEERKLTSNSTDHAPGAIAVEGDTIHVVWVDEIWPGPEYEIYYRNSTDNGASWGGAQQLVGPSPLAWAPELECNESNVCMVWNDQRDDGSHSEVYIINSTNSGGDWGGVTRLTSVDNEHSGSPDIGFSDGKKYVVWVDLRYGNEEIYFKRSPDFPAVPEFPSLLLPIMFTIATYVAVSRYRKKERFRDE